jgi:hypothetical protein
MQEQNNTTKEDFKYILQITNEEDEDLNSRIDVADKEEFITLTHKLAIVIWGDKALLSTMRQLLAEDIPDDIKRILGAVDEDTE